MKPPRQDTPSHLRRLRNGRSLIVSGESAPSSSAAEAAFFANYSEYAKTLRAWLVAYGIGGPVLFLTNKELSTALKLSVYRHSIVDLFLLGVVLQLLLAFINKWCAWHMYVGEYDRSFQKRLSYKIWSWLNERIWIDLLVDGGSLIAFSVSTWLVLCVFL